MKTVTRCPKPLVNTSSISVRTKKRKSINEAVKWRGFLAVSFLGLSFAFAGNALGQTSWTKYGSPVMTRGASGQWDDTRVIPNTVIYQDTVYKMWYSGFDGMHFRVGYAVSPDGIQWTKQKGPVLDLGPSGAWDSYEALFPIVYFDGSLYRMWYTGGQGTVGETGYDQMGYATSTDGISWTKYDGNPVMIPGSTGKWDDIVVTPGPVVYDTVFHMIYNGLKADESCRPGYATSPDGIHWTKAPDPVLDLGTWDKPRVEARSLVYNRSSSQYLLFYGGGDWFKWKISYATATDLSGPWTKSDLKLLEPEASSWDNTCNAFPCVLYDSTIKRYVMWYMG